MLSLSNPFSTQGAIVAAAALDNVVTGGVGPQQSTHDATRAVDPMLRRTLFKQLGVARAGSRRAAPLEERRAPRHAGCESFRFQPERPDALAQHCQVFTQRQRKSPRLWWPRHRAHSVEGEAGRRLGPAQGSDEVAFRHLWTARHLLRAAEAIAEACDPHGQASVICGAGDRIKS